MECPLCRGSGVIMVRLTWIDEAARALHGEDVRRACPLGCKAPTAGGALAPLVGREMRLEALAARLQRRQRRREALGARVEPERSADGRATDEPCDDYRESLGQVFGPDGIRSFLDRS